MKFGSNSMKCGLKSSGENGPPLLRHHPEALLAEFDDAFLLVEQEKEVQCLRLAEWTPALVDFPS